MSIRGFVAKVILAGGYSPCRPKTVAPITGVNPADPSPLQPPHLGRIISFS
jgi:hypothetical protein